MEFTILASGIGAGFLIAAQVGPIWLLYFRNGIRYGFSAAFGIGLGAAIIDTLYCVLGALGAVVLLTAHSTQRIISVAGGLIISWIGIRTILSHRKATQTGLDEVDSPKYPTFGSSLRLSLLATASNPLTIILWVALLSAAGSFINSTSGKITFALGVGGGSFLFFITLSFLASYLGKRLSMRWVHQIDQISAYLFLLLALLLMYRAFII
jgi:threonine/homoserine/homoserine lactone efflux protein